jgi:hypothetical protein
MDSDKGTTKIGYINKHQQKNHGRTGALGTDYANYTYKMECLSFGTFYGANGSDIWQRRCPKCDGGKPGLPI